MQKIERRKILAPLFTNHTNNIGDSMKLKYILIILTIILTTQTYAAKIKKGIKIFVPLTVGSFEITTSRIKGGKIKKVNDHYEVSDIYVPTKKLTSGIDLRDEHIHERIKNESVIVKKATGKNGVGSGIIIIRDVEKEFSFKYEELNDKFLKASFNINLKDFNIPNLSYAGVGVEDVIKLEVTLPFSN